MSEMRGTTKQAEDFLEQNLDLSAIELLWTDLSGVARGKLLRRCELISAFENGRFLPISASVLDQTGQDVHETGLVFEEGDRDLLLWPVFSSLRRAPWGKGECGQFIAQLFSLEGEPFPLDSRHILAHVLDLFKPLGMEPVCAIELEFFLFDQESAACGELKPPRGGHAPFCPHHFQPYSLEELSDFSPFFEDLYRYCALQGVQAEALISEYAPGQMEITLKHQKGALSAVDDAIRFKGLVKRVAAQHGMLASFMAKPYAEWSGNGMHIHISLASEAEPNLFFADDPRDNPLLLHALGGLKHMMCASTLLFAPNVNSYRRLKPRSYAPTSVTWGRNNRTVSLRIPAGPASSCHIEHRVSGADANPYLALSAVLAGVHLGISQKIDPGPATIGNGYEQDCPQLPGDIFSALLAFRNSEELSFYLGKDFIRVFSMIKQVEAERFLSVPTQRDFDWYLRTV